MAYKYFPIFTLLSLKYRHCLTKYIYNLDHNLDTIYAYAQSSHYLYPIQPQFRLRHNVQKYRSNHTTATHNPQLVIIYTQSRKIKLAKSIPNLAPQYNMYKNLPLHTKLRNQYLRLRKYQCLRMVSSTIAPIMLIIND